MTRRLPLLAVIALSAALAGSLAPFEAAHAQADNNFFGNLFKPPGQVRSGGTTGGAAGGEAVQTEEPGGISTRIDRLENQFRQMTGQIEQLQYRNQQLEQQVRALQGEVDFRVGGSNAGAAPRPTTAPVGAPPPAADPMPGRRSDVFDPSTQAAAPGAPRPLGTTPPSGPVGGSAGAPMDLGALSGAAAAGGSTLPPTNSPKDLYDLAYGYMLRQDYPQSAQSFEQFLKLYPNDRAAPDAYYWLGETQFQRKTYKEAAQNFLKVSTDYPNTVKAPDALLRLGQSLAAIGEKDAACATLNAVNNKYPRASATIKQGVAQEQKRVGC